MALTSTVFTRPLNGTTYVLTAINADPLPVLPDRLDHLPDTSSPRDTWRLHWAMAKYPQLPCIPATIRWDDPLLNRFSYDRSTMPIVSESGSWRLCPKVTERWLRFERALRLVAKELIAGCPSAWFPFESAFFPLPSNFGYRLSRTHRPHALECAINSRDAFVPLIAWCTFLLTFYPSPDDSNSPWIKTLLQTGDVHPEWVEQMRGSWMGDLSGRCQRVGVVVDVHSPSVALVPQYVRAHIPVWLLWTPADKPPSTFSPRLTQYYPKQEDVAMALKSSDGAASRRIHTEPPDRAVPQAAKPSRSHAESPDLTTPPQSEPPHIPVETSNRIFPPLPQYSRQKPGETWQQFFAREAEGHTRIAKCESAAAKAQREERERQTLRDLPFPGKKGPRVYVWEDVSGFRIRTPMFRKAVSEAWWDEIPKEHMRFNSFTLEWDICEEFGPAEGKPYEDLEDVVYDQPPMALPEAGEAAPTSCRIREVEDVEPLTGTAWRSDVLSLYGDAHGEDDAELYHGGSPPTFTDSLDQILYGRFGFNWQPSMEYVGPNPSEAMWKHDVGLVVQDNVSRLDLQYRGPIWKFITSLLQGDEERLQGLTWDLTAADNGYSLRHTIGENLAIVVIVDGSETFYLIKPATPATEHTVEWHVVLHNPASALQSVCLSLSSNPAEVVRNLLAHGIPFHTYIPCSLLESRVAVPLSASLPNSLPPRPPISLGMRPPQYKPDAADYTAYEAARDNFLQQGHARAALLKGGIVWRLAVEYLSPNAVFTGPSERALTCGNILWIEGQRHCDDNLTPDELDFICGVYQVYTGHGFQVAHKSWWPKQATWEKSTYNVGYWTRFAEEWFQARLTSIRNNTAA